MASAEENNLHINPPDSKNPSLKKYFRYMINSRKLTIQFTQRKIREIMKVDLGINLNNFNDLLKEVSIEAFAYYMQAWPGWQPESFQLCLDNPEEAYKTFKVYLRKKILKLKDKEKMFFPEATKSAPVLEMDQFVTSPPDELLANLSKEEATFKNKSPYTLQVSGSVDLMNGMQFFKHGEKYFVRFKSNANEIPVIALTTKGVLNHPYVSILFKIPSLIKFTRKNVHRIEMFLCKPADSWMFPNIEHILDIRKYSDRNQIYTNKFIKHLFSSITNLISTIEPQISAERQDEINVLLNEFLEDITEADLQQKSVQECTEICYSIGNSMYYADSAKNNADEINLRKIYSPQCMYSLIFCALSQSNILPDGSFNILNNFNTRNTRSSLSKDESSILESINHSITYSCTLCNMHFLHIHLLKLHIAQHSFNEIVKCTKCRKEEYLHKLINSRWHHQCT